VTIAIVLVLIVV